MRKIKIILKLNQQPQINKIKVRKRINKRAISNKTTKRNNKKRKKKKKLKQNTTMIYVISLYPTLKNVKQRIGSISMTLQSLQSSQANSKANLEAPMKTLTC